MSQQNKNDKDALVSEQQSAVINSNGAEANDDKAQDLDRTLVKFDGDQDREDPKTWDSRYKWFLVFLMAGLSLTANLTVLVCAPAIPALLDEFEDSIDSPYETLVISMWNAGATIGCLIIGPLSEVYGRLPVYHIANLVSLLTLVAQSQSVSIGMLLAFRCLNGMSIATYALNPGIVGDLFVTKERGRAQSILSLMPLLGPLVGPIAGGWISEAKGWRWTFLFSIFVLALWSLLFLICYRETYDVQILRRKAKRQRKETADNSFHSTHDHTSLSATLRKAASRPVRVFTIPIFLLVSLPGCIVEGYTYLLAANITSVYETEYGFSPGAAGLVFVGIAVGTMASALFCSFFLDWYSHRMAGRHDGEVKPEWRLPPMILGFISSPIGLFVYGWTAQVHAQYVVPIIGTGLCGFATFIIFIPMTTYLVDAFGIYRASANSALNVLRNALSTVMPLAGPALYRAVGLGWGNSVLAFVALALAPIPILLLWFGERIRKHSKLENWS